MRKLLSIIAMLAVALAAGEAFANVSQATTGEPPAASSADLALRGVTAGGETATERSHLIAVVFTLTNNGPGPIVNSSADTIVKSVKGGTVVDAMCILPNGFGINADGPNCEPGELAVGHKVRSTFIVKPSGSAVTLSVRACGTNESGIPDPVPGNNCATVTVRLA